MSLIFLFLLILIAAFLQLLSRRRGTEGITYHFQTDDHLTEPDEVFHMETTVINTRRLPVLYLKITEMIPGELKADLPGKEIRYIRRDDYGIAAEASLEQTVWLMPHQKLTRTLEVSFPRRGRYLFTSASLSAGDFLGLEEHAESVSRFDEVVVMPERADIGPFETAFDNYIGELSVRRYILPDPILTAGFREYTGREPMRDISWPRSLRDGKMMVKEYDYTAEPAAEVLLNVDETDTDTMERCFSAARTVCEKLEEKRIAYSFRTNACTYGRYGRRSFIPEGLGEQHLNTILDGLGRASGEYGESFKKLLQSLDLSGGTAHGYMLITASLSEENAAALRRFEQRCTAKVFVLPVKEAEA